jgi:hypothetical protein
LDLFLFTLSFWLLYDFIKVPKFSLHDVVVIVVYGTAQNQCDFDLAVKCNNVIAIAVAIPLYGPINYKTFILRPQLQLPLQTII